MEHPVDRKTKHIVCTNTQNEEQTDKQIYDNMGEHTK